VVSEICVLGKHLRKGLYPVGVAGLVVQGYECCPGMAEVGGSIPPQSTTQNAYFGLFSGLFWGIKLFNRSPLFTYFLGCFERLNFPCRVTGMSYSPSRDAVLWALAEKSPLSASEVIKETGLSGSKAYHALDMCWRVGLVLRAEKAIVRGELMRKDRDCVSHHVRSYHMYVARPEGVDSLSVVGIRFMPSAMSTWTRGEEGPLVRLSNVLIPIHNRVDSHSPQHDKESNSLLVIFLLQRPITFSFLIALIRSRVPSRILEVPPDLHEEVSQGLQPLGNFSRSPSLSICVSSYPQIFFPVVTRSR
jgi:hypothetical protein